MKRLAQFLALLAAIAVIAMAVPMLLDLAGCHPDRWPPDVRTKAEIDRMIMALTEYFNEFSAYPPGGVDLNDDGNLDDPGDSLGSGKVPADPAKPTIDELQLRAIAVKLPAQRSTRTVGPYYSPIHVRLRDGAWVDLYGNPFRYLADGRRQTLDPATGKPLPGRVFRKGPVIWSVGPDGKQDPQNNNLNDDQDGKVDEPDEMEDDICSWH